MRSNWRGYPAYLVVWVEEVVVIIEEHAVGHKHHDEEQVEDDLQHIAMRIGVDMSGAYIAEWPGGHASGLPSQYRGSGRGRQRL